MDPREYRKQIQLQQYKKDIEKQRIVNILQNISTEDLKKELKRRKKANENWRNF